MIIFLHGSNTYRSRQKLNEIIRHYKEIHKSGLSLKYFDADKLSFQDFEDEMKQASMFREKKLVVLMDAFSNSEFKKKFAKEGKIFVDSEDTVLFYEKKRISEKDPLFVFLGKHAKSQEFEALEGQRLKSWLIKEFERLGAKIEDRALQKLVDFVGHDSWQMINEVKKLASFKNGREIEVKDVEVLVRPKVESDIFKTIDAIASKDKKKALRLLRVHLKNGDSPFYLFSMINFQFRNLLIVKDLMARNLSPFGSAGLHPFVVRKSCILSRKFEFAELKKIYRKIFQVDFNVKTGKVEPEIALDLLITEI